MSVRSVVLALALCAQAAHAQPVERPTPGTVTVEASGADGDPETSAFFVDAVQHALSDKNFVALPTPGHARYTARIMVRQTIKGHVLTSADKAGPAVIVSGARIGVTLPTGKTQGHDLVVTELEVEILQRADQRPIWHGSALTARAQGTRSGSPYAVATDLADVLIMQFPQAVEGPISVP